MKYLYKLGLCIVGLLPATSCVDREIENFTVEKPLSIALQEEINAYAHLNSYVDKGASPSFKLSSGVSVSEYLGGGILQRLIHTNFDEVAPTAGMDHGSVVQDNGTFVFSAVNGFLTKASEAGLSVYGQSLITHTNQNAEYLLGTITPPPSSEPTWEPVMTMDFETDDATNYQVNDGAVLSFTAGGEGANGEGRALKVTNSEVRTNEWDSQIYLSFTPAMVQGEIYELSMAVRSDDPATSATQAQAAPGAYLHWDFFGGIASSSEWTTFTKQVTVSDLTNNTATIAINLGLTATNYYFDNITLTKYTEGGGGGSALDPSVVSNRDFEGGIAGWGGWGNGSTVEASANGEGYDGSGVALRFSNPSVVNPWEAQVAYEISAPLQMGETYVLNFKVRSDIAGSMSSEIQTTTDYTSDSFGSFDITPEWTEHTLEVLSTTEDRTRLLFSYGAFAGTVYLDDVSLSRVNPNGGGLSPEEEEIIISAEMEKWIVGMMEASRETITSREVVSQPMDDINPSELRTGEGNENLPDDEFYWQDYLGKNYAVKAFKLAREHGKEGDVLFISDNNLASNLDKCRGLIGFVDYIEANGAAVDGIATQMNISVSSNRDDIVKMFELLTETGKLIKVSNLAIALAVSTELATAEDYQEQKEMYHFVVETYLKTVPPAQQYGISIMHPAEGTGGLWTTGAYNRKPAYAGFADGLGGTP